MQGARRRVKKMMARIVAPFVIEVTRGGAVESRHFVAAAVADTEGRLYGAWGDVDVPVFPRSAIKPLQALPFVHSGAADAFGVTPAELALATGSQIGTPHHVEIAETFRQRTGINLVEIACGVHAPYDGAAAQALARHDEPATVLHNNCIGKHLGMIATARHLGEPIIGYIAPDHPVQRRIVGLLEALGGHPLGNAPLGIDGCSAPNLAMPLRTLARAFARFAAPEVLEPALGAACRRVAAAMTAEPVMVAGRGRLSTDLIALSAGTILLKEGAEGVAAGALPHKGLGFALKVADGAGRAAEIAAIVLLRYFGALGHELQRSLAPRFEPEFRNWHGIPVGVIRVAGGWLPDDRGRTGP